MTRILLLTDADVFAGTERHIVDLAHGLREVGVDVAVGCPGGTPLAAAVEREGMAHVALPKRGAVGIVEARRLARMLRRGQIDLIHAHNGRTALQATLAKSLAGRGALVMTQHFITPSRASRRGLKARLSNMLHRWMSARLDRVIAISTAVRDAALQRGDIDRQRIAVVHNGMVDPASDAMPSAAEVRRSLDIPADAPLIVCAARLQPEKDVRTLVDAMGTVLEQVPEAQCVIAGRGAEEANLRHQITSTGLQSNVRLLGFRDDVRAIIAAADVFALPAKAEPFGLVLLEAMALGRPVIATAAGGPLDIVVPEETGILVEPEDAPAMANAIIRLLSDASIRSGMGRAGRERFLSRFVAQRMARETLTVYQGLLADAVSGQQLAAVARTS